MKSPLGTSVPADFVDRLMTEISHDNLRADLVAALNPPPAQVRKTKLRTKRPWRPTERQRAILDQAPPNQLSLEKYLQALDHARIPFPEKYQRKGLPKSHQEAWDSKNERLLGWLKSERRNAWKKAREGQG
jgi:hypothetical protein